MASGALLAFLTAATAARRAGCTGHFFRAASCSPKPRLRDQPARLQRLRQKTRNPDQKFVEEAAHGGMAEVEAGKLAQKQASQASVKAFAEHMVTDHTRANDQLKQIAMTKGMTLPTETGSLAQARRSRSWANSKGRTSTGTT